ATIVSVFSLLSVAGSVACGFLPRGLPIRYPLAATGLIVALGTGAMLGITTAAHGYVAAAIFGFGIGAVLTLLPIAWADYFGRAPKDYKRIPVAEQVEVLSLLGDVAEADGKPTLHIHAVLGKSDGTVVGGHLLEGHVRPTLEVILTQPPAHLRKKKDPETGLALIALDRS